MKLYIVIDTAWNDIIIAFTSKTQAKEYIERQENSVFGRRNFDIKICVLEQSNTKPTDKLKY